MPNLLRTDYITQAAQHAVDAPENRLRREAMEQHNVARQHAIDQFKFRDEVDMLDYFIESKPHITFEMWPDARQHFIDLGAPPELLPENFESREEYDKWMIGAEDTAKRERERLAYEADEKRKKDKAIAEGVRRKEKHQQEMEQDEAAFKASELRKEKAFKALQERAKKTVDTAKKNGEFSASHTNAIGRIIERELNIEWDDEKGVYLGVTEEERQKATEIHRITERQGKRLKPNKKPKKKLR
jgi:hypothetical protein